MRSGLVSESFHIVSWRKQLTSRNHTPQHQRRNNSKQTLTPTPLLPSLTPPTPQTSLTPLPLPRPPLPLLRLLPRQQHQTRITHIRMIERSNSAGVKQRALRIHRRSILRRRKQAATHRPVRRISGCGGRCGAGDGLSGRGEDFGLGGRTVGAGWGLRWCDEAVDGLRCGCCGGCAPD